MRVVAFAFFLIFLAGIALVNLKSMQRERASRTAPGTTLGAALVAGPWRVLPGTGTDLLRFDASGTVAGFAGCNRFSGRYGLDEAALRIDTLRLTRKACAPDLMSAEAGYVHILQQVASARLDEQTLTLQAADGSILTRLQQAPGATE